MSAPDELVNLLWHGDSIEECKKFKPGRIQSVITDPPFGVDNQSNSARTPTGKAMARKIENDETPEQAMNTFAAVMESLFPALKADSDIYVFTSYHVLEEWLMFTRELFKPEGFERKAIGVWEKEGPGQGDTYYKTWGNAMEYILHYKRGKRESTASRRNFVLHIPQLRPEQLIHPHEKPPALLELLIQHSTDRGDWVVDPFGGSGSLSRAAKRIGRNSVAIEKDPYNFELAKRKLEHDTGGIDFD